MEREIVTHYSQQAAAELIKFHVQLIQKLQSENERLKEELNACYSQIL
jgi:F0F1-type ATP synthase membrane subunit b/b'